MQVSLAFLLINIREQSALPHMQSSSSSDRCWHWFPYWKSTQQANYRTFVCQNYNCRIISILTAIILFEVMNEYTYFLLHRTSLLPSCHHEQQPPWSLKPSLSLLRVTMFSSSAWSSSKVPNLIRAHMLSYHTANPFYLTSPPPLACIHRHQFVVRSSP